MCPVRIRTIATNVFLFKVTHGEYKSVSNELFYISDDELKQMISGLGEHEFVYVRMKPYRLHINFRPCTLL